MKKTFLILLVFVAVLSCQKEVGSDNGLPASRDTIVVSYRTSSNDSVTYNNKQATSQVDVYGRLRELTIKCSKPGEVMQISLQLQDTLKTGNYVLLGSIAGYQKGDKHYSNTSTSLKITSHQSGKVNGLFSMKLKDASGSPFDIINGRIVDLEVKY